MKRPSRPLAALAAAVLLAQSTGAASLSPGLFRAPGAFPPPSARFAAFPPKAAAAPRPASGPSALSRWLDDARVVARALLEELLASAPQDAPEPKRPERAEPMAGPITAALPAAEPEAALPQGDRMLIAMPKGESVEAVIVEGEPAFPRPDPIPAVAPAAVSPDFQERWVEEGGVRARLTYRAPHGLVTGVDGGFRFNFAGGQVRFAPQAVVPELYHRSYPIYWQDERVEISVTVVNRTGKTLKGLRVEAGQETFRPVGTEGARLGRPQAVEFPEELAPGESATGRLSVIVHGPSNRAVNLEQTHLRVSSGDEAAAPLLDVPQAGVIDPPGPGVAPSRAMSGSSATSIQ